MAITHYDLWHAATRNRTDRYRYMLKFLFDRQTEPRRRAGSTIRIRAKKWPDTCEEVARRRIRESVSPQGHSSDYYQEWELRTEMWHWMLGRQAPVPPGAFKDMLA